MRLGNARTIAENGGDIEKINIASSTASETATSVRQIFEKQGLKLSDEDIE